MRLLSLFLTLLVLFSLVTLSVSQSADSTTTHVDAVEEDNDIAQPIRTPGLGPSRERSPRFPRTPRTRIPRDPRLGLLRPRRGFLTPRPRRGLIYDPPMTRPWMFPRLSLLERRMILNMFRDLLRLRLRSMMSWPTTRWEQKMLRLMVLRDMIMTLDMDTQDAAAIQDMIETHDAAGEFDDLFEPESESQDETWTEEEPETEDVATAEDEVDDPTLLQSEFDISAPYGGYGGFGGGYGFGGYGGGYGGKKAPYKKVPYKKVPYKKVPYKKGGYGYGGYGGFGGI